MALVIGDDVLTFGAISGQQGPSPQITLSQVRAEPASNATGFTGLTWYGPDNVITLAQPGPAATEYPVSGGTPTSIPVEPGMETITASSGNLLIAGLPDGKPGGRRQPHRRVDVPRQRNRPGLPRVTNFPQRPLRTQGKKQRYHSVM